MSLVVPVHPDDGDADWLLGRLPPRVSEVILVGPSEHGDADVPHAGLLAAAGDYIVVMGADGSMSPREIPHYLHYLESGYDFVKGSRFIAGGDFTDYPLLRRLGHHALLRVARRLYGQHLTDLWYGFCAFRRGFVDLLDLRPNGYELGAELVAHALHYGLRVAEVPSLEQPRRHGPAHPHTVRDGARILGTLLDERPHNVLPRLAPGALQQ
ncbi:glycosyltransferase family 2 protein [Streptomyces solicathayae]|uniref:Glycosyltransferase family 2 protein n=1 Tax=Streptomyces solicathayae TaxID=3081768 RepID=A0ABZ0LN89_9ACTN|nr:glycosyltransferase family 2 protein [Streptomyces sp. HUAS YS2]WOX20927.1 glycosyltransferase family 2 protein [Streptomyces sp. HUAS YS2]